MGEGESVTACEAVRQRLNDLCRERDITTNALSLDAGVPQSTVKSIMNGESKNPGIVTLKKLCDSFGITLGQFFSNEIFDKLEQEIQ